MGLSEQLREGATLQRRSFLLQLEDTGTIQLGPAVAILNTTIDSPCRLRLYDNETGLIDPVEESRPVGESSLTPSLPLVADLVVEQPGEFSLDPVLYATPDDGVNIYYRISNPANVFFTIYELEDPDIVADPSNVYYRVPNRRTLVFSGGTGVLAAPDVTARTYLMIGATASHDCRLRIYARASSLNDANEQVREFCVVADPGALLLADMELGPGEDTRLYPKIIGANLDTLPTNLENIRLNRSAINARSEIYYRLEPPLDSPTPPEDISVTLDIFAIED